MIDFKDIKTTDHILEIPGLPELLLCFLLTKNESRQSILMFFGLPAIAHMLQTGP